MSSVNAVLAGRNFQNQLAFGQMAETEIARWFLAKGAALLPIYDREYDTDNKKTGPRLFCADAKLIAPDLLAWRRNGKMLWIEAKHKTVFTRSRIFQCWNTGIDERLRRQYEQVQEQTGIPVSLLFLHKNSKPSASDLSFDDCPPQCPTGLFGDTLEWLTPRRRFDRRYGKDGMNFWTPDDFRLVVPVEKFLASIQ